MCLYVCMGIRMLVCLYAYMYVCMDVYPFHLDVGLLKMTFYYALRLLVSRL